MFRRHGGWRASSSLSDVPSATRLRLSRRPVVVFLASILPLLSSWAVPILIGSGCRADQTASEKADSHQIAYLAVMQRQISPAVVIVHLIHADGSHVLVEYVPPDLEITKVSEGHLDKAAALFEKLELDGFFEWPDSSLVPPPGMDVDSDPLVIVLDTGKNNRRMFTREPHIHPALQSVLDTLASAAAGMTASDGCLVCIPQLMRVPESGLYEIKNTSAPWTRKLLQLSTGPFPLVVPQSEAETTEFEKHDVFSIRDSENTYRVKCINWP